MAATNGRLPDAALTSIPGGGRLLTAVAATWLAICAEVHRLHGWTPTPTGPLDSYRPYATQVSTFQARYTRTPQAGRPTKVWGGLTYWLLPGKATAAVPGTSNHGWACAVDVTGLGGFAGARYREFGAVATRHGWTNTEGRSIGEPWHWVDVGTAHLVANGLLDLDDVLNVPDLTAPDPIHGGFLMALTDDQQRQVYEALVKGGYTGYYITDAIVDVLRKELLPLLQETKDRVRGTEPAGDMLQILRAELAGTRAAVAALATAQGLDPDAVRAAAEQGARDALADLTLTVKP